MFTSRSPLPDSASTRWTLVAAAGLGESRLQRACARSRVDDGLVDVGETIAVSAARAGVAGEEM